MYVLLLLLVGAVTSSAGNYDGIPPSVQHLDHNATKYFNEAYFEAGQTITLVCQASGKPKPYYMWRKDNVIIQPNPVAHGNLTLSQMSKEDEGNYQCLVINQYGTAASDRISLHMNNNDVYSGHQQTIPKSVLQGGEVALPCLCSSCPPDAHFTWGAYESPLEYRGPIPTSKKVDIFDSRFTVDEYGTLHIVNIKREDAYTYACCIESDITKKSGPAHTAYELVLKLAPVMPSAPRPVLPNYKQSIAVTNKPFTINCLFTGNPTPSVTWTLPEQVDSSRINWDYERTSLTIQQMKQEYEGEYRCTGSNSEGNTTHGVRVTVQSVPEFVTTPTDRTVLAGRNVDISCRTRASPPVQRDSIQWSIDAIPIKDVIDRRFSLSDDHLTLTFRNVCKVNCGPGRQPDILVVQCNTSNVHGYAFKSTYLNVVGPTAMMKCPNNTTVNLTDSNLQPTVTFSCGATFDPTAVNSSISWWRGPKRIWPNDDRNLNIEEYNASYSTMTVQLHEIKTLPDWRVYNGTYHCIATNGYKPQSAQSESNCSATLLINGPSGEHPKNEVPIIAIVVPVVLAFLLLLGLVACCLQRSKQQNAAAKTNTLTNSPKWRQVVDVLALNYAHYIQKELPGMKEKLKEWASTQKDTKVQDAAIFDKYIIAIPGDCQCPAQLGDFPNITKLDDLARTHPIAGTSRIYKMHTYTVEIDQESKFYFTAESPAPMSSLVKLRKDPLPGLLGNTPSLEDLADRFIESLNYALTKTFGEEWHRDVMVVKYSGKEQAHKEFIRAMQRSEPTVSIIQPTLWQKLMGLTCIQVSDQHGEPIKCDDPAFGQTLAYNFYFAYIEKVLPGLLQRLETWKNRELTLDEITMAKPFVLMISEDGKNPVDGVGELHKKIKDHAPYPPHNVTTSTMVRRDYAHPVYEVTNFKDKVLYFTGNFCTCLDTLEYIKKNGIAEIEIKKQRNHFVKWLKEKVNLDVIFFEYKHGEEKLNEKLYNTVSWYNDMLIHWEQVVDALALNYYFEYLRKFQPDMLSTFKDLTEGPNVEKIDESKIFHKFIIVIPQDCVCPKDLTRDRDHFGRLPDKTVTLPGMEKKEFKIHRHFVKDEEGNKWWFAAEFPEVVSTIRKIFGTNSLLQEKAKRFSETLQGILQKDRSLDDTYLIQFCDYKNESGVTCSLGDQLMHSMNLGRASRNHNPTDPAPGPLICDGLAFSQGLAYNYIFGYLRTILPGLLPRVDKRAANDKANGKSDDWKNKCLRKFVLMIPNKSQNPRSAKIVHEKLETLNPPLHFTQTVGYSKERQYSHQIFKVTRNNGDVLLFPGGFFTPIDTLYQIHEHGGPMAQVGNTQNRHDELVKCMKKEEENLDIVVFTNDERVEDVNNALYSTVYRAMYGEAPQPMTRLDMEDEKTSLL